MAAIEKHREGRDRSDWIRDAIGEKLHRDRREEALIQSIQRMSDSLRGIRAAEKMNFAGIAALAKLLIICVREPTGEVLRAALETAPAREKAFKQFLLEEYGKESS